MTEKMADKIIIFQNGTLLVLMKAGGEKNEDF
jgi:hypothetical protein